MEPILSETSNRYVLQPIIWTKVWEAYKQHQQAFWTAEEIDFSADLSDWEKLNENENSSDNKESSALDSLGLKPKLVH